MHTKLQYMKYELYDYDYVDINTGTGEQREISEWILKKVQITELDLVGI